MLMLMFGLQIFLAVDTLAPVLISGALAGETCLEKAVGIAAMVKTQKLPMQEIADRPAELGVTSRWQVLKLLWQAFGSTDYSGNNAPACNP